MADASLEVSACCSSARRTRDVQMFGAICINISEFDQAAAAGMVTVSHRNA
jgi:hypothetical protein